MTHVLVAAHAGLSKSLIVSSELIMGSRPNVHFVEFVTGITIDTLTARFFEVFLRLEQEDKLLILVDVYGGSVGNVAASFISRLALEDRQRCECISGVNLSMLLTALELREDLALSDLKEACYRRGKEAIRDIKQEFKL